MNERKYIKAIISSKNLYSKLTSFILDDEIEKVIADQRRIWFLYSNGSDAYSIIWEAKTYGVESIKWEFNFQQWENLRRSVQHASEQPMTVDIDEDGYITIKCLQF